MRLRERDGCSASAAERVCIDAVRHLLRIALAATLLVAARVDAQQRADSESALVLATPFGFNIGRHWSADNKEGLALGGELSAVAHDGARQAWFGGFIGGDVLMQSGAAKLAFGAEAGVWPAGIDIALLWTSLGRDNELGFQARVHLTQICSSLYGGLGVTRSIGDDQARYFGLFGLLIKMPVVFSGGKAEFPMFR